MQKRYNNYNLIFLLTFLLGLYVALNEKMAYDFETRVFLTLRNLAPAFDIPMKMFTELGSAIGVISMTAIIIISSLFMKKFYNFGLPVSIVTIISYLTNTLIKFIVDRPRPEFRVFDMNESSFPSGHSQNNMALYIAILFAVLLISSSKTTKRISKIICISVPLIIGISRLYFGVHFFSDVISGWSLGFLIAYNVLFLYYRIFDKKLKQGESNDKRLS